MVRIPDSEEFSRNWDWFSVDEWTLRNTADRALPESVRSNWERAELLITHFEPEIGEWTMSGAY